MSFYINEFIKHHIIEAFVNINSYDQKVNQRFNLII